MTKSILVALILVSTVVSPASAAAPLSVVALGDSTASGTGAGDYEAGTAGNCWRSRNTYSEVVAAQLRSGGKGVSLHNVACSGATISELRTSFKGQTAQLDALDGGTNLVLLTAGANDVGFAEFGGKCIQGDCSNAGQSVIAQLPAMAKNLLGLFGEIKAKSPQARIVVTGYGRQLALGPNAFTAFDLVCAPIVFTSAERAEGNKVASALDLALRETVEQARTGGADVAFASPYTDSVKVSAEFAGHAQCESGLPYYRGFDALLLGQEGREAVLHLNKNGQAALAGLVAARLR